MNHPPLPRDFHLTDGYISLPLRVDQAVALQPRQKPPAKADYGLEVLQAGIPAVHQDIFRLKPPLLRFLEHGLKVVVFALPILGLVVDPKVAGDQGLPLRPQQGHEGDAPNHPLVFAAPVVTHQVHVPSVGLIQGGVVQDQQPLPELHEGLGLLPQRRRVGRLSLQQAGKGIMGGRALLLWTTASGLGTGEDPLSGDEKVDVVQVIALRWVHGHHPLWRSLAKHSPPSTQKNVQSTATA